MEKRQSISYPELTVNEIGEIFLGAKHLKPVFEHSCSTRGPVISYTYREKQKQVSAMNIIYEAWVKEDRITRADLIGVKNGNAFDLHPSNLCLAKRAPKRVEKLTQPSRAEGYTSWLNGDVELFC